MATVMAQLVLSVAARLLLLRYRTVEEVVTAPSPTAAAPGLSEQPAIAGRPAWAPASVVERASYSRCGATASNRGYRL